MHGFFGRVFGMLIVGLVLISCISMAASKTFINETGNTVYGITITFSKKVAITRHDNIFPTQGPSGQSEKFTFSGGKLRNFGRFSVSWIPSTAVVVNYDWNASPTVRGTVPAIETQKDTFQINIGTSIDGVTLTADIHRTIVRGQLPFSVRYEVSLPSQASGYTLYWDLDRYVDTNGDGNAANDRDKKGRVLELTYTENYNPTVTLQFIDKNGKKVATWENMIRNDFHVGQPISIDGRALMSGRGIDVGQVTNVTWTQRHMQKLSLEYMTEYEGTIVKSSDFGCQLTCKYPGKYVLDAAVVTADGKTTHIPVIAWVVRDFSTKKPVSFMMSDLWNEVYDKQTDRMRNVSMFFSDYDVVRKLDYLRDQGFRTIDVMDIFPLVSIKPYPVITHTGEGEIGDQDLTMIFSHIPNGNLDWETYYYGPVGSSNIPFWTDFGHLTQAYYEHFFSQYHDYVLQEAALAGRLGLSSFMFGFQHPYLWGLNDIKEKSRTTASWVRGQWISLCDDVRSVFHGKLGIGVPARGSFTVPITQHVDFIYENLGNFGGHTAEIQWARTVEDLRTAYSLYLDKYVGSLYRQFGVPVRFTFWAYSYDNASTKAWIPEFEQDTYDSWKDEYRWGGYAQDILEGKTNPKYPPNFREQVKMIEAMMPILAEKPYIEGIVSEYEYWKLLSFTDFKPDNVIDYFQVFAASLQGKPGFEAFKFWASMIDPNDRLVYRHVVPPMEEGRIVIGDSKFIADNAPDWSTVPYVATFPEDYSPAAYWDWNGQEDISKSTHWAWPGHDLKGIKVSFTNTGLAIRWETHKSDIQFGFTFELRFASPSYPGATVFIDVNPRDKMAEVQLRTGGKNYYLESSIAAFVIEKQQATLYLKDVSFPKVVGRLHDLQNWQMSAFVLLLTHLGNEYYEFPVINRSNGG